MKINKIITFISFIFLLLAITLFSHSDSFSLYKGEINSSFVIQSENQYFECDNSQVKVTSLTQNNQKIFKIENFKIQMKESKTYTFFYEISLSSTVGYSLFDIQSFKKQEKLFFSIKQGEISYTEPIYFIQTQDNPSSIIDLMIRATSPFEDVLIDSITLKNSLLDGAFINQKGSASSLNVSISEEGIITLDGKKNNTNQLFIKATGSFSSASTLNKLSSQNQIIVNKNTYCKLIVTVLNDHIYKNDNLQTSLFDKELAVSYQDYFQVYLVNSQKQQILSPVVDVLNKVESNPVYLMNDAVMVVISMNGKLGNKGFICREFQFKIDLIEVDDGVLGTQNLIQEQVKKTDGKVSFSNRLSLKIEEAAENYVFSLDNSTIFSLIPFYIRLTSSLVGSYQNKDIATNAVLAKQNVKMKLSYQYISGTVSNLKANQCYILLYDATSKASAINKSRLDLFNYSQNKEVEFTSTSAIGLVGLYFSGNSSPKFNDLRYSLSLTYVEKV